MNIFYKGIKTLTNISKWGALTTIFLMMAIITISVISREVFNTPVIGDYELVQILMVSLIGFGLSYAESIDGHIKVGLVVDRFSEKVQTIIDIVVYILVVFVTIYIGTVQLKAGLNGMSNFVVNTQLLEIPHYPFQLLLFIGFYLWGLEALLKIINKTIILIKKDYKEKEEGLEKYGS